MISELEELKRVTDWATGCPQDIHSLNYNIDRLKYFVKELFKYSKFKIGDIVQLKETPEISEKVAWGWLAYKNILTG